MKTEITMKESVFLLVESAIITIVNCWWLFAGPALTASLLKTTLVAMYTGFMIAVFVISIVALTEHLDDRESSEK